MFDLFKDASLLPHGFCLLWNPWLIAAHLVSDILIFASYSAIPVAIYIFLKNRPTLAMSSLAWLFALFILFCGLTHLAGAVALYQPIYEAQAAIKLVTAGVSVITAFVIFPLIPKALAIPSPEELQQVNARLQNEVEAHVRTAAELREARDELQKRVDEQTTLLTRASAVVAALEESPDVLIYAKGTDGKILMANPASIKAIGRPATEVIGKDEGEFLTQSDEIAQIQAVDRSVCETGQPVTAIEKVTQPDGTVRIYQSTKVPLRNDEGEIDGIVGVSVDVSEREILMLKLVEREELLRLGSEAAAFGTCVLNINSGVMKISDSLEKMLGLKNSNLSLDEFISSVHPGDRELVVALLHTSTAAELEFRGQERWFLLRGQHKLERGQPHFIGAIVDITRRKRAETRTSELMRELIHRGRNLLTVVQVLARNSLVPPRTLKEAGDVLVDRLHAFARGYELFVDGDHVGLTLRELIASEASRFPDQFVLMGPEFLLNERSAQTLGLVIHELTTNAAKYGALSKPHGCVEVSWSLNNDDLSFSWREMDGPTVAEPQRKGFGTGLIERMLRTDFNARYVSEFKSAGFTCSFTAPLHKLQAAAVGEAWRYEPSESSESAV